MNEQIKPLVIKYITGDADASEQEYVRQWIGESQDNMDYYISLKETWQDALHHPDHRVFNADKAFERLRGRLQVSEETEPIPVRRRIFFLPVRTAVAVVLLLIAGVGVGLYLRRPGPDVLQTAFDLFVPNGKMKKLILPDSTEVWLNAGTRFSYPSGFGQTNREVTLDGEGYFAVHHNEKIPFIVKAGGYKIRDIGTAFTIIAYPGNKSFETAVLEGKVEVTSDPKIKGVLLARNEVLKVSQPAAPLQKQAGRKTADDEKITPTIAAQLEIVTEPHIERYASWKDNILVFEEESFEEVARRLERTYNVRIRINNDRLAQLKYTGRFTKVQTITEAMKIIRETTPIVYTMENDTVSISLEKR
ncbi:MAG TPA: FecR family protein [Puia sp.]|jgi:ferric-dicitrate binding protein FerR (iron transport regulator)